MRYTGAARTAGTFRLRAAVLGGACLISLGLCVVPASAAPADVTQLSVDQLPTELVDAIARDLKMSPEQYLQRASDAQRLRSYADDFRAQHPSDYAGAWIGDDGVPVVAVTTDEAAREVARDGYQTRQAPVSADGLEASLDEFNRWASALPREISSQINSAGIDFLNNRVVVDVANTDIGRVLNLPTLIANLQVVLAPVPAAPNAPGAMGGDTYVTTTSSIESASLVDIGVCSFGFNAESASGDPVNLTAGHCNPNNSTGAGGATVFLPDYADVRKSRPVGTFDGSSVGAADGLDYASISLNAAGVAAGLDKPTVRGANGGALTITGTAEPVVGAPVCKSGQSSSFTCGVVAADHVETQLLMEDGTSRTIDGFASTACTLSGDSGGAIVTGTLALGITSGSNSGGAPSCSEANLALAQYGGTASLGIPVERVVDATGATIRTSLSPA
ncbi:serine protease [Rhodococcoides trifolii]|uniref:Serine protease n=1 Tax=Rhodococcoides trifolii TaxID=908250 RepID=A0A917G8F1_9NOCA|nr:S1 family peptidase [Rhodococcus trifolii]GGG28339.1 serine protease [Rhodococcus trifolii]